MKNSRNILIGMICASAAFLPIQNFAQDDGFLIASFKKSTAEPAPIETQCQRYLSMIQFGGNYTYVNLKPKGIPEFHGNLGGAQALYEYRPWNNVYAGVKGFWRQGHTSGHGATRSLLDINVHQRLGYTFASYCKKYFATLFTGIGYRYLGEKLIQNRTSLRTNYNEFYVPVGFLTELKFNQRFSAGLNATWMPQVNSTVTLLPIGGAQWILKKKIANVLVELPLNCYMGSMFQYLITLKPFYEFWQDGKTTAKTVAGVPLGLPGNTYNFWGTELDFGFKF